MAAAIQCYNSIDASVKGTENQFIRLSAEQLKEADKEMKAIADEHGPHFHKIREAYDSQSHSAREIDPGHNAAQSGVGGGVRVTV